MLGRPGRASTAKAAFDCGVQGRSIETKSGGERIDVVKVLHAAVPSTELYHCFEFLCYRSLTRIGPYICAWKVRQHRRVFDFIHIGCDGVANSDVYLHANSRRAEMRPKQ